jgi:ribosomal protein S18 acetylase RimI-like enzyme
MYSATINHIEENFFAVSSYWGSLNNSLKKSDSIRAMSSGVAISDINWVWNEKPLVKGNIKSIEEIREYYKKLNLRFWWWVYPRGKSPETSKLLLDAGFRLFAKVPSMATDLKDSIPDDDLSYRISVLPVQNKNGLNLWKDISFDGFEMPSRVREQYGAFVSLFDIDAKSPQKLFIAYLDEKPAATSLLFTNKNTAGIYYVSTLPAYRNNGCGLKITRAAMRAAKESGFKDVILQATPAGAKIYKRAGFNEYCRAEIYKL